jgi:hypothetical protein
MAIQKPSITKSAKGLYKEREKLNFDLAVQRKNNIWDIERKSLFIHSLLYGYPVPPFYAIKNEEKQLCFLDGKQRLTSLFSYMSGEYPLSDNIPEVEDQEIAGKYYEDLSEDFRDRINETSFLIYTLENINEEEIDEMFYRLNNGVSLTKMELSRALAGSKVMSFIEEIANTKFFSQTVNLTDSARNRYGDQEVIMQIVSLLYNQEIPGLSGKELQELAQELRDTGIPEDVMKDIRLTTQYLEQALPAREKFLKKINIPMIFIVAKQALADAIAPDTFGGWVQTFFRNQKPGDNYGVNCSSGSAKKEKVKARIDILMEDYRKNIYKAPKYEMPKPKESTGKRGRPSKNNEEQKEETDAA